MEPGGSNSAHHSIRAQLFHQPAGSREKPRRTRPWQYHYEHNGVRYEYHQLYNSSDSQLHSEMGVDGMGNLETIRKILLPENQKVTTAWDNLSLEAPWRMVGHPFTGRELFRPF